MSAPLFCTRCTAPLDAPSATGLCARCAAEPGVTGAPPARPQQERVETPVGAGEGTHAGDEPNPFAPTHTGPFEAPTADPPPGAPGAAPRPLPLSPAGYQIIGYLGGGGMGDVFSAMELASNRLVALKFMRHPNDPGLFGRFVDEFGVLANLEHTHVVRVFAHDFHRADPYFTMELMDGGSLADRLTNGPLAAADAVELIRKVAAGVQALHELRCYGNPNSPVIHRDIKPKNVLLTAAGEPKLADFGLVKYLDAATAHTMTGDVLGTAQYMPPEQINRANGALDVQADVYGLGATLYHLLTGYAPFNGETVPEILHSVLVDPPVRPRVLRPEITRGLESVVLKCLEKDPRDRYQSVAEFVAALDLWAARDVPEPRPLWQRVRRWVRDHKRAVAAVVLGLALVGGVAAVWPTDPLADILSKLRRGAAVEIVGERGPPRWYRWAVGNSEFDAVPPPGGGVSFATTGTAMLEVLPNPGIRRYRVALELAQLEFAPTPNSCAGVYMCAQQVDAAGGVRAVYTPMVWFTDRPKKPSRLEFGALAFAMVPLHWDTPIQRKEMSGDHLPGPAHPWRRIEAEVDPEGITLSFQGRTHRFHRTDLAHHFEETLPDLRQQAGAEVQERLVVPPPDGSLGVFAHGCRVGIRRFTVTPVPPPE